MADALRGNLERLHAVSKPVSTMRMQFYAAVTRAVVEAGVREGQELSSLLPAIQAVFARSLCEPLARIVSGGRGENGIVSCSEASTVDSYEPAKRRLSAGDEEAERERSHRDKRARMKPILPYL